MRSETREGEGKEEEVSLSSFVSFVRIRRRWVGKWDTNKFSSSLINPNQSKTEQKRREEASESQLSKGRTRRSEGKDDKTHREAAMFLIGSLGVSITGGLEYW